MSKISFSAPESRESRIGEGRSSLWGVSENPFFTRLLSDFVEIWLSLTDPNTALLFICECFGNAFKVGHVISCIVLT